MGITWTVLIGLSLIGLTLFLKRNEWFNWDKKKGVGTVSTSPQTTAPTTEKKEPPKEKETLKSVWWPRLVGVGVVILVLWIGLSIYRHFSSTTGGSRSTTSILGTIDVPTDKWSGEISNPSLGRICWGRLDLDKGGECKVMMDKDPKKIFPIRGDYSRITPRTVQFKCSEKGAQISVKTP